MTHRILVTGCGGDLGQAVIKSLRSSAGPYEIHGCDCGSDGLGESFVERYAHVRPASDSAYLKELDSLCAAERISAVVPCSDAEIAVFGTLEKMSSGTAIVCQPEAWTRVYGDKLACMKALEGQVAIAPFVDGADARALAELVRRQGFPLVVKPRVSFGSRHIVTARNAAELESALQMVPRPLVQAYLDDIGGEYSVGVYRHDAWKAEIAFKRTLKSAGCSWYAETSFDPGVLDYCRRIADASGLRGSANVQLRMTAGGPFLLEINPRFSSLAAARAACGFNDVDWSVRAALRLKPPHGNKEFKKIRFRRFFHEMVDFGEGFRMVDEWSPRGGIKIK
jgi:carbamoyl-phosphate synthase large subunit